MLRQKLLLLFTLVLFTESAFGQAGMWTCLRWISPANFGVQGIPASLNNPPPVYEPAEWTDLQGNFWFFGGSDGSWNEWGDLWKYDPNTNMWTWMKGTGVLNAPGVLGIIGVPDTGNHPPSKSWGMQSWTDLNGDLWLYGGLPGIGMMWKYNIATNIWTRMSNPISAPVYGTQGIPAPSNTPGHRDYGCATWVDGAGLLWLFGGSGYNDLWNYNVSTNEWTWMKGSNPTSQPPTFGTMGVEDSTNIPNYLAPTCTWKDNSGNFWFFGGGPGGGWSNTNYNVMWKYNPLTNNWTWMGVPISSDNFYGNYGPSCTTSSSYYPSARLETRSRWVDNNGNFWLLGGGVHEPWFGNIWKYDDLWFFNPTTLQWAYVNGSHSYNQGSIIGTIGVPDPNNRPGAHYGAIGWKSLTGDLYLFGGGFSTNALWKYTIDTMSIGNSQSVLANFTTTTTQFCDSACIDFTDNSTNSPTSWFWSFPGAVPDTSIAQNPTNICYTTPGIYTVSLIASNAVSSNYIIKTGYITITNCSPTQGNFIASQLNSCDSTCVDFTDISSNNPISWNWNFPGGVPDTSTAQNPSSICYTQPGSYPVELIVSNFFGTDTIIKSNYINIHETPTAIINYSDSVLCLNDSVTFSATTSTGISYQWFYNSTLSMGDTVNSYTVFSPGQYYFMTSDSFGCQKISDTVTLTQDTFPLFSQLYIPFSNCIIANLCAPYDSSYSYFWNTNESTSCIAINTSGNYQVIISNVNGCNSIADTTFIFPSPSYYIVNYPPACDSIQLCGPPGSIISSWSNGASTLCTVVYVSGSYIITAIDSNYCTNIGTLNANIISLNSSLIQSNDTLLAYPVDSTYNYLWLYNGITNPLCDSLPYCITTANGTYQVIVSDTNGCIDTSIVFIVTNVGLNQNASTFDLKIIPNPTTDYMVVELTTYKPEQAILNIVSPIGQQMKLEIWNLKTGINTKQFDLSHFNNGVYHFSILIDGIPYSKKFEIIHN